MKNADAAALCIARALKPGGRFVAEFGGHGNIQSVVDALREVLGPVETPWYYPSIGEYATVLEQHGLEPQQAWLIDRPTPVEGEDGMEDWLAVFARDFVAHMDESAGEKYSARLPNASRPHISATARGLSITAACELSPSKSPPENPRATLEV